MREIPAPLRYTTISCFKKIRIKPYTYLADTRGGWRSTIKTPNGKSRLMGGGRSRHEALLNLSNLRKDWCNTHGCIGKRCVYTK